MLLKVSFTLVTFIWNRGFIWSIQKLKKNYFLELRENLKLYLHEPVIDWYMVENNRLTFE